MPRASGLKACARFGSTGFQSKRVAQSVPWTCRSLELRWVQKSKLSTRTNTIMQHFRTRSRHAMIMNRDIHVLKLCLLERWSGLKKPNIFLEGNYFCP